MPNHHSRFGSRPKTTFPHGPGGPRPPLVCDACLVAVRIMLAALPARHRRLLASPGAIVVLTPPSEAWVAYFQAHLHASLLGESTAADAGWFDPEAAAIIMSRTQRWEPWPEVEEGLALAEEAGQILIAISHAPTDCLPQQLNAVAHHVAVPPLTEAGVRRLIRVVTGQVVRGRVSGDLGNRLTPEIIAQASRGTAGSRTCLTTMMKLSGSSSAGLGDDGHLQVELHQSGAAAKWARQAGARVLGWQEHDLAKPSSEVALLAGPADQTRLLAVALADATRARMVTVRPGDVAALLSVAERVNLRSRRVRRGTPPLLVYIDALEFVAAPGSPGRAVLSGLLKAAAGGAATVVVGATDSIGGIDTYMLDQWGPVRHIQSKPNVRPWLHPNIKTAH